MSNIYGKGLKAKATKLHSQVVRARGRCERCGESDYSKLECAHIIGRRYNAVRVDPVNAWALCHSCHRKTGEWASEHMALIERTIGLEMYELLRLRAERGVRANDAFWQGWIDALTEQLREAS